MQYEGDVIKPGDRNLLNDPGICCEQCRAITGCQVWEYCPESGGCGIGHALLRETGAMADREFKHKECWLKTAVSKKVLEKSEGVKWVSGTFL